MKYAIRATFFFLATVVCSASSQAADGDQEYLRQCVSRKNEALARYSSHVSKIMDENAKRASERARLAQGMTIFVDTINILYRGTISERARLLELEKTGLEEGHKERTEIVKKIQERTLSLANALSFVVGLRIVFTPSEVKGTRYERSAFFASYYMADSFYDRDTYFRDPALPQPPKSTWDKFVNFIDLDAPAPRTSQHFLFEMALSAPILTEQKAKLTHDPNWTAEELINENANYGYGYLMNVKIPTEEEFVRERIGFTCALKLATNPKN